MGKCISSLSQMRETPTENLNQFFFIIISQRFPPSNVIKLSKQVHPSSIIFFEQRRLNDKKDEISSDLCPKMAANLQCFRLYRESLHTIVTFCKVICWDISTIIKWNLTSRT